MSSRGHQVFLVLALFLVAPTSRHAQIEANGSRGSEAGLAPTTSYKYLDAVFGHLDRAGQVCVGEGGFECSLMDVDAVTNGIALGYVNGDGFLDAVYANGGGQPFQVCLGQETWGFRCSLVPVDSFNPRDVALGFVNEDQNIDAVFANWNERNRVCLGDGESGFSCSEVGNYLTASAGVALGFVNSDVHIDAVFANLSFQHEACLGDGSGGFTCSDIDSDPSGTSDVALGFINGDEYLDALFLENGQGYPVCLGDGLGGFSCIFSTDFASFNANGVALGHVNNDPFLDAVVGTTLKNQVCFGDGIGGFGCTEMDTVESFSGDVALGLVNDDLLLDAVFATYRGNRLCIGIGDGSFNCRDIGIAGYFSYCVALGHLSSTPPIFAAGFATGNRCEWSESVPNAGPPCADFSHSSVGLTVQFQNETAGSEPLSYTWSFGDYTPNSYEENPSHTYALPGTYRVDLLARNAQGTDSTTKAVTVGQ